MGGEGSIIREEELEDANEWMLVKEDEEVVIELGEIMAFGTGSECLRSYGINRAICGA
jgi:hypothetical protein